ncbi:hypothetical protein CDL12_14772 [Handroanthus impetiginosus]|uniref:TF-B3 domain-containing protein n=1 Tax=Handroanthus impetiginosus TaxID=429701 RepID=A0A2G9H526_9LAMI|nr:hypothetical protein CDL12_14772 [Handroanthus impetiginosus]
MEGKLATIRHFFKVMMPGFHEKLNLPPAFCEKVKQEKSEWAIVKSRKGTWKVRLCRNGEGLMCLKDGWANFVNKHGLSIGDFVLFEHIGHLHFNAFVFDPSACEREFVMEFDNEHEGANGNYHPRNTNEQPTATKESRPSSKNKNPHFAVTMQPHHAHKRSKVTIPAEFSRTNNIFKNSSVTLRDPCKKQWLVKLLVQKQGRIRCRMERGWYDFYVSNKLKDGDVCVFNMVRRSIKSGTVLMDVQIFAAPP